MQGPGSTTIRWPQQQQLWRGRFGDVLVPARLSAAGPTGCHVPGWRTAHMERPSAKVCGYVVSRFHSLRCLKLKQFLEGCIEALWSLDLWVLFQNFVGLLLHPRGVDFVLAWHILMSLYQLRATGSELRSRVENLLSKCPVPQMQLMSDKVVSQLFVQGICNSSTSVIYVNHRHLLLYPV